MTKNEYADQLNSIAEEAAESQASTIYWDDNKKAYRTKRHKGFSDDWVNKRAESIKEQLKATLPYDSIKAPPASELLSKYPGSKAWKWLNAKATGLQEAIKEQNSPEANFEKIEQAKYAPLVENSNWYGLNLDQIREAAKEQGIKWKDDPDLLEKLRTRQIAHDRGQLVNEAMNDPGIIAGSIAYPSMTEEALKQIATGEGSNGSLVGTGVLDAAVNSLMLTNPITKVTESPIVSGIVDAAYMTGMEAGRQGGKKAIDSDLQVSPGAIVGTFGAAATRPALTGLVQGYATRVPGEEAKAFSRGFASASRSTNPVVAEREKLGKAAERAEELSKNGDLQEVLKFHDKVPLKLTKDGEWEVIPPKDRNYSVIGWDNLTPGNQQAWIDNVDRIKTSDEFKNFSKASNLVSDVNANKYEKEVFPNQLDAIFGTEGTEVGTLPVENARPIYSMFDQEGKIKPLTKDMVLEGYDALKNEAADTKQAGLITKHLPAKAEELGYADAPYKLGRRFGNLVNYVGGKAEPTFKITPSELYNYTIGNIFGNKDTKLDYDDYGFEDWTKDLSDEDYEEFKTEAKKPKQKKRST